MTQNRDNHGPENQDQKNYGQREAALDRVIDFAASQAASEALDPETAKAASARVLAKLRAATPAAPMIEGCAAFQALIPSAVAGSLDAAQRMLLDDHIAGCPACRRAWLRAKNGIALVSDNSQKPRGAAQHWTRWASIAAALATVALLGWHNRDLLWGRQVPTLATITDGGSGLIRISDNGGKLRALPLATNDTLRYGESIRTPKGSGAIVTLQDGSRVELRERSEITLLADSTDTDIKLTRGDIIVQAAKQGSGHLWVSTPDARVSVVGTVFTVDAGLRGSRVSVLEGEVHVDHARKTDVLHPGDQVRTDGGSDRVPLSEEVAWSKDRESHEKLIAELRQITQEIRALPERPERHSTRLLDLMPEGTLIYAGLPNVSGNLGRAYDILKSHMESNPQLAGWWAERHGAQTAEMLDRAISQVKAIGELIGDELAIGVAFGAEDRPERVLMLTTVADPAGFAAGFAQRLAELRRSAPHGELPLELLSSADAVQSLPRSDHALYLLQQDDLLIVSSQPELLLSVTKRVAGGGGAWSGPLHDALAVRYQNGVSWIGGFDFMTLLAKVDRGSSPAQQKSLQASGFAEASAVIVEGRSSGYQATIDFSADRHGVASWLAAPSPMGAIEFVSPQAYLATSVAFKDPSEMLSDIQQLLPAGNGSDQLTQFGQQVGIDIKQDLIGAIGGDAAFAIDGPVLPVPAWKFAIEVYDPARLQSAIERLVASYNQSSAGTNRPPLALDTTELQGRTLHTLHLGDGALGFSYTFVDGYLLAASQNPVLLDAINSRAAGLTLTRSENFSRLLPADRENDLSAFVYSNLGPLAKSIASAGAQAPISEEHRKMMEEFAASAEATLQWAYGEPRSLTVGTTGGLAGLPISALFGLQQSSPPPELLRGVLPAIPRVN